MKRLQAFKFVLLPNGAQQRDMRRFAGSCRFVFNRALALQQANYQAGERFIGYLAMAKHLTQWRHSAQTPWLKDAPVHPLQHALKDLELNGQAACWWQCLHTTPVRPAPAAGTWRPQIDAPKPNSYASNVRTPPMQMWLARSMF
jgi:hypothetical protein